MNYGKAIAMCALSLVIGVLVGIYTHSQIVASTIEKLQDDAKRSVITETIYK